MAQAPILGPRVRSLRRREGLSEVQLAKQLETSASYLNLIEHNRRPLTAPLLIRLAEQFDLDLATFSEDGDATLLKDLHEVFGDPLFEDYALTNKDLQDLTVSNPEVARAVRTLYLHFRETRGGLVDLASKVTDGQTLAGIGQMNLPSEEVSDMVQVHQGYFPALDEVA